MCRYIVLIGIAPILTGILSFYARHTPRRTDAFPLCHFLYLFIISLVPHLHL
ncbi:hypothetical protein F4820DRAFT_413526 [Hypoxylon rubiginosum]|uniref:Uncharacterized protein n=1 Tax=Hypoxylon rubiginosum TaxID=110542 RepID=A0ACB9Z6K4_9PEZI|nr:hypothetical protein F4820DRAFT_413526 [Hypoxylon rubiginosum]